MGWNELSQEILEASDFPQKLILSDDQVEEIQTKRREDAERQQALEAAQGVADAIPKISKDVEENSHLALLTGAA